MEMILIGLHTEMMCLKCNLHKLNFKKDYNVDDYIDSEIEDCIEYLIDLDHQSSRSDL